MTKEGALKKILVEWAIDYEKRGNIDCLFGTIEKMRKFFLISDKKLVVDTWFPEATTDDSYIETFIDVYNGWMTAIWENMAELMLGTISIDRIIVEQAVKETDL